MKVHYTDSPILLQFKATGRDFTTIDTATLIIVTISNEGPQFHDNTPSYRQWQYFRFPFILFFCLLLARLLPCCGCRRLLVGIRPFCWPLGDCVWGVWDAVTRNSRATTRRQWQMLHAVTFRGAVQRASDSFSFTIELACRATEGTSGICIEITRETFFRERHIIETLAVLRQNWNRWEITFQ